MPLFRRPEASAWRPAPVWQSLVEAVVVAALATLTVAPSCLGLGGTMRVTSWILAAVLVGVYGWAFNRLRPANPPADAIVPWRVGVYGAALLAGVAAQVVAALVDLRLPLAVTSVLVVAGLTGASQWFERGVEAGVRAGGLDRSPRKQSVNVLKEARAKARGREDVTDVIGQERASERWAREQRERREPRAPRVAQVRESGGGAALPAQEQEPRRVYRPVDRLTSDNPNKRKKRRR